MARVRRVAPVTLLTLCLVARSASTRCFSCGSSATVYASCEGISAAPTDFAVSCDEIGPVLTVPGCVSYQFLNGTHDGIVVRACARYDSVAMVDKVDSCKVHALPEGAITFCYCSTDWCNAAMVTTQTPRSVFLTVVAVGALALTLAST